MTREITLSAYTPTMTLFATNWDLSKSPHIDLIFPFDPVIAQRAKLAAGEAGAKLLNHLSCILGGCHEGDVALVMLHPTVLGISVHEVGKHQTSVVELTIRALVMSINETESFSVYDKRGGERKLHGTYNRRQF